MAKIHVLNLRAIGHFNPFIFTVGWIIKNIPVGLRPLTPNDISVFFNPEERIMGFEFNGIRLLPDLDNLNILALKKDDQTIAYSIKVFEKILKLLNHTPIRGIGFNIVFKLQSTDESKYLGIFKSEKNIDESSIKKVFYEKRSPDPSYNLNIISSFISDAEYLVEYNYHFPSYSAQISKDLFMNFFEESKNDLQ